MTGAQCARCGAAAREGARFCPACGEEVPILVNSAKGSLGPSGSFNAPRIAELIFNQEERQIFRRQIEALAWEAGDDRVFWLLPGQVYAVGARETVLLAVTETELLICADDLEVTGEPLASIRDSTVVSGTDSVTVLLDDDTEMLFTQCGEPWRIGWFCWLLLCTVRAPRDVERAAMRAMGTEQVASLEESTTEPSRSAFQRLAELGVLHSQRMVSDAEYERRRTEIINDI